MSEGSEARNLNHLVSGGIAGTVAVIVTCPLEVVKTRLQSSTSVSIFKTSYAAEFSSSTGSSCMTCTFPQKRHHSFFHRPSNGFGRIYQLIVHIVKTEGAVGLFRGIGPTVVGVAPHKAIYFYMYNNSKVFLSPYLGIDNPANHLLSSGSASFTAATVTNPIWFVKTRLQLECTRHDRHAAWRLMRHVYQRDGLSGFYRGVTASYYGISETMIYFVLYERLRLRISEWRSNGNLDENRQIGDYFIFMMCSALCKSAACSAAYPHEVARTRMREECGRYKSFWQTLQLVFVEEGVAGLYRGLFTALVRQIPNAAISMATYETIAYYLKFRSFSKPSNGDDDDDGSVSIEHLVARN